MRHHNLGGAVAVFTDYNTVKGAEKDVRQVGNGGE